MSARIVTWMAVAAMCLYSSFALPSLPEKFSGTWILDTRATEESVIRNHPYDDVRAFSTELLYMGFTVFEFDGEVATAGPFAGPNKAKYRLSSAQPGKLTYIAENVPGSNNSATLTATILPDGHLCIVSSGASSMRHLLWKQVQIDPNKKRPDDFKPELDAWMATLQNILRVLENPPKP